MINKNTRAYCVQNFYKLFLMIGIFSVFATNANAQNMQVKCKNQNIAACQSTCNNPIIEYAKLDGPYWPHASISERDDYFVTCTFVNSHGFSFREKLYGRTYCHKDGMDACAISRCNAEKNHLKQRCKDSCKYLCSEYVLILDNTEINTFSQFLEKIPAATFKAKMLSAIPDGDQQFKAKVMTLLPSNKIAEMYDPNFVYQ